MNPINNSDEPVPAFPSVARRHDDKGRVISEEFIIPDDQKQTFLEENYPFAEVPKLSERRYDLHAGKNFVVRDYKFVREEGSNYIVSPYYYEGGGTVIDWMPFREVKDESN